MEERLARLEQKVEELQQQIMNHRCLSSINPNHPNHNNHNVLETPSESWKTYVDRFTLLPEEIEEQLLSRECTYGKVFSSVIQNIRQRLGSTAAPLVYVPRRGMFVYSLEEEGWSVLNHKQWFQIVNRIHLNVFRVFLEWKSSPEIKQRIRESDGFSSLCDQAVIRWMKLDLPRHAPALRSQFMFKSG